MQTVSEHHEQFPTSNAGTGLEVMALELKEQLGFSWKLDEYQQEALEKGALSMLDLDSVKKQVARYKSNFSAYVANTIDGVFPKKRIIIDLTTGTNQSRKLDLVCSFSGKSQFERMSLSPLINTNRISG